MHSALKYYKIRKNTVYPIGFSNKDTRFISSAIALSITAWDVEEIIFTVLLGGGCCDAPSSSSDSSRLKVFGSGISKTIREELTHQEKDSRLI